jgi:hypothetical protein
MYAFGMLIVEVRILRSEYTMNSPHWITQVLTGIRPFPALQSDASVIKAVAFMGARPVRAPEQSASGVSWVRLWDVAEMCWQQDPRDRPKSAELLSLLAEA